MLDFKPLLSILSTKLKLSRNEAITLILILAFVFLFFKPVISAGDPFGYYVILKGIVDDGSFDLKNQLRFNEVTGNKYIWLNEATQRYYSRFAPGFPIISIPLYSFSLLLDDYSIFHIKDEYFLQERGDILIHQFSVIFTSLLLFLLLLFLTLSILKHLGFKQSAWLALLLTFFASPIIRYASYDLSYSHVAEAALFALAIWVLLKKASWKFTPIIIGALTGLLSLVRYTSALFLIPFACFFALKKNFKGLVFLFLSAIPFFAFLSFYFAVQFGSPLTTGYESSYFLFIPWHFFDILFNLDKGFLVWSPLLLISIAGLFFLKDKLMRCFFLSFIFLYLLFYGAWSSWFGGWGFGNRFFIVFFPLFAVGIAQFWQKFPKLKPVIILLAVYSFFLALLFFAQTSFIEFAGSFFETVNYWIVQGNFASFPAKLFEKIALLRFLNA